MITQEPTSAFFERPTVQRLDDINVLFTRGRRLSGASLEYRRNEPHWPGPWRVKLIANKNERFTARNVAYGDSAQEAIELLNIMYEVREELWRLTWERGRTP